MEKTKKGRAKMGRNGIAVDHLPATDEDLHRTMGRWATDRLRLPGAVMADHHRQMDAALHHLLPKGRPDNSKAPASTKTEQLTEKPLQEAAP